MFYITNRGGLAAEPTLSVVHWVLRSQVHQPCHVSRALVMVGPQTPSSVGQLSYGQYVNNAIL